MVMESPLSEPGKAGRAQAQADRQPVWSPPSLGEEPPAVDSLGHAALHR